MNNIQTGQKFNTAKLVLTWNCNMACSYCCNEQKALRDTFIPIRQSELKDLPHDDIELTGGELTLSQYFSWTTEFLRNDLPKGRNYYFYTNGVHLTTWNAIILKEDGVKGINVGFHPNQPVTFHGGESTVLLKKLDWQRLWEIHNILPIRLWVQDLDYRSWMDDLGYPIKIWKLGDCDKITTDRYVLSFK